jgi:L-alanine-DL-glutamate epimerase-like enolase superfamily enzyme
MISNAAPLKNGYLALPTDPGLGWVLDRSYIAKYRINERATKAK